MGDIKLTSNLTFNLRFCGANKRHVERYQIFLNLSKNHFLFGKCYVTRNSSRDSVRLVTVIPAHSTFYNYGRNWNEQKTTSISEQITELLYSELTH